MITGATTFERGDTITFDGGIDAFNAWVNSGCPKSRSVVIVKAKRESKAEKLARESRKHQAVLNLEKWHYEREQRNAWQIASVWIAVADQVKEW